ncbi:MAG: putative DNA-binding regulatory protein, partial [Myxococcales bacterium]|nr:putative DNA-binding regulatory protein [Myxococcales bacterium]
ALAAAAAAGRATWPGVDLADEELVAALATKMPPGLDDRRAPAALLALQLSDLYLATACAAGSVEALVAFERHLDAARPAVRRIDSSSSFADEVLQLLREKLFVWTNGPPRITAYAGRGPIAGWVRVAAIRTALNLKRGPTAQPTDDANLVGNDDDLELGYLKSRYREAFQAAFETAMASLAPSERTLLRLHFVDGLPLDQIAIVEQVSRATAGRRLQELRARLAAGTRTHLQSRLGVDGRELESLVGLLQSQLALSLSRILR